MGMWSSKTHFEHTREPMNVRWVRKDLNPAVRGKKHLCLIVFLEKTPHLTQPSRKAALIQLGDIEERYLKTNVYNVRHFMQGLFWVKVEKKLDQLNLEPVDRKDIERKVSQKVARPPVDWALWGITCVPRFDP
jgi:hypothetical protein